MRISETKTSYILIRAQVQSEWDSCNCALVEIADSDIENWKKYDRMASDTKLKSQYMFAHLAMYKNVEFLLLDDESADKIPQDAGWAYVQIDEDEDIDDLPRPEQQIDCHMIKYYGNGGVCWVGSGKYTSEEFWTTTININEL